MEELQAELKAAKNFQFPISGSEFTFSFSWFLRFLA
jgi:hypothetical protein